MTRVRAGTANTIIFGFSDAQYLHGVTQKAHGLPEKNVALLIRKEQLISCLDDFMAILALTGKLTFLYCDELSC